MSAADRVELQAHLDQCPRCARRLELEDAFLGALKKGMARTPAPPGLETRIRASLDAAAPAASKGSWYRMPWVAAVAASLLLGVMLVAWGGASDSASVTVAIFGREVIVVDRDCDRMGKTLAQQAKCRHREHRNALKISDGSYWKLVDDEPHGRMIGDPHMRGHRLVVDGTLYPAIGTLRLRDYRDLDPQNL